MDKIDFDALADITAERVKAVISHTAKELGGHANWGNEHHMDHTIEDFVAEVLCTVLVVPGEFAFDDGDMELAA